MKTTWLVNKMTKADQFLAVFDTKKEAVIYSKRHGGIVEKLSDYDKEIQKDILNDCITYDYRKK